MSAYSPTRSWRASNVARRTRQAHRPPRERVAIRLFLPLTPFALLFAPFALLLGLVCMPLWPALRVNPLAAVLAVGRLLFALSGTDVSIDTRSAVVRIRIF
jgi:hypothetical protein